jgi:hypothetical protein
MRHVSGGGVAAHHDVSVATLLKVRIKDRFAGRALVATLSGVPTLELVSVPHYCCLPAMEIS